MSGKPKVLVVDGPGTAGEVAERVEGAGIDVETAADVEAATEALASEGFDCAISRENVPDDEGGVAAGTDVLRALRGIDGVLPVVLFGEGRESVANDAIAAGLADYVAVGPDGDYDRLVGRIRNAVSRRQAVRRAEQQARTNEVIRDVHQALVRADSREAIEESVCEQFARSEQYTFAWIAGVDEDDLTFRAMGVEGGAVEGRGALSVDEGTAFTEPAHRAAERRDIVVLRDVGDRGGAWEAALDRPFEAVAAVPFVYEDRVYGALLLYADRRGAFGDEERQVLAELGENVAYAINAVAVRRKFELRELQLRRQNEQLEAFAGVVSHDLRNPLTVARGYATLIEGDEEAVEKIDDSLARMEAIIDDVLTLARQGRTVGETEPVDLGVAAEEAWSTVDTGDVTLDTEGGVADADRSRLVQLLENLFRNAVEHGDPDTIRVGRTDAREAREAKGVFVDAASEALGSEASEGRSNGSTEGGSPPRSAAGSSGERCSPGGFFVEDDGEGLPDVEGDDLFESGVTTAEDGTGFGLAIVRSIAEAHGWDVAAGESEDGGARFEFAGVDAPVSDWAADTDRETVPAQTVVGASADDSPLASDDADGRRDDGPTFDGGVDGDVDDGDDEIDGGEVDDGDGAGGSGEAGDD